MMTTKVMSLKIRFQGLNFELEQKPQIKKIKIKTGCIYSDVNCEVNNPTNFLFNTVALADTFPTYLCKQCVQSGGE